MIGVPRVIAPQTRLRYFTLKAPSALRLPERSNSSNNPFNAQGERSATLRGSVQNALKDVMRGYPQGVTVVTTKDHGVLKGITVSSFISVSLQPPLILVSIAKDSGFHEAFRNSTEFAVNFLAEDQKSVSDRFAGRLKLADRFQGLDISFDSTSAPIIGGVKAFVECKTRGSYEEGDHSLIIGEVVNAIRLSEKSPLVYQNQQYTTTFPSDYPAPPSDIVY